MAGEPTAVDTPRDASVAETSAPANVVTGDAAPEVIIGNDIDAAIVDAGVQAVEPPVAVVDGGPCDSVFEEWNTDPNNGAWIPATTWSFTGPVPQIRYQPIHGGYFTTNVTSVIAHPLIPTCHYVIGMPIRPPNPMPADLTFARITNTDPSATITAALTSSTDDAGVLHGYLSMRLGGQEILKDEISLTDTSGFGVIYTLAGALNIGINQNEGGWFFNGADAGPFAGFTKLEVGVIDGPTPTAETLFFGVVDSQWNDTQ